MRAHPIRGRPGQGDRATAGKCRRAGTVWPDPPVSGYRSSRRGHLDQTSTISGNTSDRPRGHPFIQPRLLASVQPVQRPVRQARRRSEADDAADLGACDANPLGSEEDLLLAPDPHQGPHREEDRPGTEEAEARRPAREEQRVLHGPVEVGGCLAARPSRSRAARAGARPARPTPARWCRARAPVPPGRSSSRGGGPRPGPGECSCTADPDRTVRPARASARGRPRGARGGARRGRSAGAPPCRQHSRRRAASPRRCRGRPAPVRWRRRRGRSRSTNEAMPSAIACTQRDTTSCVSPESEA